MIDSKLAYLLSKFFLDLAKAYYITTFITPPLVGTAFGIFLLTKGIASITMFLYLARKMLEFSDSYGL